MSGHSKWHNIQKTKGAADAKRSATFTKIAKEIIVAVKQGGSGDPNNNSRLATVIAKAKAANMPNDNIKRTIDKALGSGNTDNYESVTYEGYGPCGVAVIVEALTDNRQRTAPEIRHYFDKFGKGMGAQGCVSWSFDRKGVIVIDNEEGELDEDTVMMDALDAGAEDMQADGPVFEITTDPDSFNDVVKALEEKGYSFESAEIEMVPAYKAVDIGLDRGLIGSYGQDDRVCAYTALMAEIAAKNPEHTTFTILTDKEEIGSVGNTGLHSDYVHHAVEDLAESFGADTKTVLRHPICLSSDVNAAYDPTFASVYENRNSSYVNKGCVLTKYTGARGKSGSSDASAETMAKVIGIMEENGVYWQTGELGAVDAGGGGTIAQFVAMMDVDVVDLGVPILSMHAPFELASKLDVYNTYKAFCAFYK